MLSKHGDAATRNLSAFMALREVAIITNVLLPITMTIESLDSPTYG